MKQLNAIFLSAAMLGAVIEIAAPSTAQASQTPTLIEQAQPASKTTQHNTQRDIVSTLNHYYSVIIGHASNPLREASNEVLPKKEREARTSPFNAKDSVKRFAVFEGIGREMSIALALQDIKDRAASDEDYHRTLRQFITTKQDQLDTIKAYGSATLIEAERSRIYRPHFTDNRAKPH